MISLTPAIQLAHVWKHYRTGSHHDSLRDAIPALLKRLSGRNGHTTKSNEFWALRDVSFHVAKGETLGIIGPNGAGKSTILKLLSRIARQTKGSLRVQGRLAALIELGGGFHSDLTGAENIYLQGTMLGLSRVRIAQLYEEIVAFSELEEFLQTPVKRYSSGMVVRLGFAIAAYIQPDVLLLDEVLAVGDLAFQQKSFQRIAELKAAGTTMIFISHDLDAVQKLCDRVLLLAKGSVVDEGAPPNVIRRYREDIGSRTDGKSSSAFFTDGSFKILNVRLVNRAGAEVETLEMGDGLRVEIAFKTERPIRHPDVQIGIGRVDGLACHFMSSRQSQSLPEMLSGQGVMTIEYPAIPLLPNSYDVTIEVYEGRAPVPIAEAPRCRSFQITSNSSEQGTVHLEHRWLLT